MSCYLTQRQPAGGVTLSAWTDASSKLVTPQVRTKTMRWLLVPELVPHKGSHRRRPNRLDHHSDEDTCSKRLLIVGDHLRCRFGQFKLCAHLLDLRCLLFDACSEGFNLFLLLRSRRFQLLHLAMLLEKLVEQHRVHRFVADAVNLALLIPSHQIGVDLLRLLRHKPE